MHEIAKELHIGVGTVYNYMKKYDIKSRTAKEVFKNLKQQGWEYPQSARERISKAHTNKTVSEESRRKMSESKKIGGIGHKKIRSDGYVSIYFPDYPKDDEVVHHINGVRNDNRKENLKLMTFSEHARHHMLERCRNKRRNDLSIK